jgi:predicted acyltransferase
VLKAATPHPEPALAATPARPPGEPQRSIAIDAFRGFVMFLMLAEVLRLGKVASSKPLENNETWKLIKFHTEHVEWFGCSLHDLIQPSFSFLVGVALPFSIASRLAKGHSKKRMIGHAAWRALVLVVLGVFLRSVNRTQTYYTFEDTLSQIGLGYVFLFILGLCSVRVQLLALVVVLAGYWAAFAIYPAPPADFDYATVGVKADAPYLIPGFLSHWNKNSNLAWAFDTWFLNLFPREKPFTHNGGGYSTLSFIPTLGTMILGLIAGGWMRKEWFPSNRVAVLTAVGLGCMSLGFVAEQLHLCPIVKKIWTPAWTLYSGGWCFLFLAGFHLLCDVAGFRKVRGWAYFFIVIGANSIFIYVVHGWFEAFIAKSYQTHLGKDVFLTFGEPWEPLVRGAAVLLVYWLMLVWMYRRRIFVRI